MMPRLLLFFLCLGALLLPPCVSRAQDLGSTATAMGAMGAMEANPMRGGQQQINRAAAISGGGTAAPPAPAAPPAAAPPATASATAAGAASAAATAAPADAAKVAPPATPAAPAAEAANGDIHDPFRQSFFFTSEDIIQIRHAMEQQKVPPPTAQQLAQQQIPAIRRIALAGVSYRDANNWLIWINGQKVTPYASMKEIVDIKVEQEQVHLKWFDIGANKVLDITMRPNETYDIPTGVLLPGVIK